MQYTMRGARATALGREWPAAEADTGQAQPDTTSVRSIARFLPYTGIQYCGRLGVETHLSARLVVGKVERETSWFLLLDESLWRKIGSPQGLHRAVVGKSWAAI